MKRNLSVMTYSNLEKFTAVIVEWLRPMANAIISGQLGNSQPVAAANEWVKKYFPVASDYSIVNDLMFLATPALSVMVEPAIQNAVSRLGLDDERIPSYAMQMTESLIAEAENKGKVTLFNTLEFEKGDFENLRNLLNKNLPVVITERYQVKT